MGTIVGEEPDEKTVHPISCHCRTFFSAEIHFYEEFYNLVGADAEKFDDEHREAMREKSTGVARHYFCKEINFYEEFYNIAPGDQLQLDDDHLASIEVDGVMEKVNSVSSHFYCKPIDSYE